MCVIKKSCLISGGGVSAGSVERGCGVYWALGWSEVVGCEEGGGGGPCRACFLLLRGGSGSLTQARRPQLQSSLFQPVFLVFLLLMTAAAAVPARATTLTWLTMDSIEP